MSAERERRNAEAAMVLPTPGSNLALAQGCTCPVIDNDHGRGVGGDGPDALYWINDDCPLHGSVIVPAASNVAALIAELDAYRERLRTDYRYRSSHAGLVIDCELGELLDPYRERRP